MAMDSDQTAMEDAVSLILRGCSSAADLQLSLSHSINPQPDVLSHSCDDIIAIFSAAQQRLRVICNRHRPQQIDVDFEEWLRSTCTQAMELAQMHVRRPEQKAGGGLQLPEMMTAGSAPLKDAGKLTAMGSSSSRRRKDDVERTVRVAAPRIGNTEVPPDDGFTWRKYGQKEILGSRFPRAYFRCTHQKLYNCAAKKHVQRLDGDPFTFEVTYRGHHTCHMSSTAPSIAPPHMSRWLSVELSTTATGSGSGGGGGVDQFPVVDMADVMFNSGSCSSNSMDSIFPVCVAEEQHQKREKEDERN